MTGSVALRAQTAANAADVAVQVFLLIGVLSSIRPPDRTRPLGYGRERFFWSLLAALGIFLGGGVLGLDEAVCAALHPSAIHSYPVAYLVLVTTVVLDAFALEIGLRPVRKQAAGRGVSLRDYLMIAVPGSSARITRAACSPSVACPGGILMSMIASSGRAERTWASSSVPFPAWPTTSNPERSSKLARPSRSRTSSSASTTRGALRSSDASAISGDVATPRLSITSTRPLRQGKFRSGQSSNAANSGCFFPQQRAYVFSVPGPRPASGPTWRPHCAACRWSGSTCTRCTGPPRDGTPVKEYWLVSS